MENVCLIHRCSFCCDPVKIRSLNLIDPQKKRWPFVEMAEIHIPESAIDRIRLKVYYCKNFDRETGKCSDYENRPSICRKTFCEAFKTYDYLKQKEIVDQINEEKFVRIKLH